MTAWTTDQNSELTAISVCPSILQQSASLAQSNKHLKNKLRNFSEDFFSFNRVSKASPWPLTCWQFVKTGYNKATQWTNQHAFVRSQELWLYKIIDSETPAALLTAVVWTCCESLHVSVCVCVCALVQLSLWEPVFSHLSFTPWKWGHFLDSEDISAFKGLLRVQTWFEG